MQLNIITGPAGSGKTMKLRALEESLAQQAPPGIVSGTIHNPGSLLSHVMQRIDAGDTNILIDDCSRGQIEILQKFARRAKSAGQLAELTIHAVKAA